MIYLGYIQYINMYFNLIMIIIDGSVKIEEHDPQPLTLGCDLDLYCIVIIQLTWLLIGLLSYGVIMNILIWFIGISCYFMRCDLGYDVYCEVDLIILS